MIPAGTRAPDAPGPFRKPSEALAHLRARRTCPGQTFETRTQADGRELHQCTTCGRVNRTTRTHQVAGRTTASHDSTMGILWAAAAEPADIDTCPRCGGIVGADTCEDCLWPEQ